MYDLIIDCCSCVVHCSLSLVVVRFGMLMFVVCCLLFGARCSAFVVTWLTCVECCILNVGCALHTTRVCDVAVC